jgi:zinc transporter ZupT
MLMLIITELYPEGEASWCCVTTHHEGAATATFLAGLAAAAVLHEVTHRVVSGSHPPHEDKVLEAEGTEASALLADDGINMPRRRQATESALHVAVGLCLHNIPEGFLLFVNTLKGGNSGTLLIIAVTLHNIPIGAIVGSCVLAATGRRWKALLAAFGVGLAFPIAGLVAWAAGDSLASPTATAVSFALTAGILTFVCVRELLPAVFVRDSSPGKGTAVTSIFIGMALMAIIMVAMTEMGGHTH